MWSFYVSGEPKGQPRPKAYVRGDRASVYDPGTADAWKNCIVRDSRESRPDAPLEGAIHVEVEFHLPRPKRLMRKKDPSGVVRHKGRPDLDNLVKAFLDALTDDGWWKDDAQVCSVSAAKYHHAKDGRPGAFATIGQLFGTVEEHGGRPATPAPVVTTQT